jgi:hypothetical protein
VYPARAGKKVTLTLDTLARAPSDAASNPPSPVVRLSQVR